MEPKVNTQEQAPKKKSNRFVIVLIILVVVGGAFGITKYIHSQKHEETDDAQVDAGISPVIPRISGYIAEIRVNDNQMVKKGDTLIILDNRDEKIKLDQAEATLTIAKGSLGQAEANTNVATANIGTSQANISGIDAQIEGAKVNAWRAKQDFERYSNLIKDHSITQQQYEQAEASMQTTQKTLQGLIAQKNAANNQANGARAQSNASGQQVNIARGTILQREADVENAKLNLSYTVITAQEDGYVSKVNVQIGQYVQAGQMLFSVVNDKKMWVVGNFKETQLQKMKIGQNVTVHVDAYPSHDFEAKLTSFSPATGAKFALLPPDNATGNFVKVVQRLPVKIEFSNANDSLVSKLRPGMNVNVDVHID